MTPSLEEYNKDKAGECILRVCLPGTSCIVSSIWFSSLEGKMDYFFLLRTHYTKKMLSSNRKMLNSEKRMPNSKNSIPCYSKKMPSSNRKMLNFDTKMKKVVISMPYCFMNTNSFKKNAIIFVVNEISLYEKVIAHCLLNQ